MVWYGQNSSTLRALWGQPLELHKSEITKLSLFVYLPTIKGLIRNIFRRILIQSTLVIWYQNFVGFSIGKDGWQEPVGE